MGAVLIGFILCPLVLFATVGFLTRVGFLTIVEEPDFGSLATLVPIAAAATFAAAGLWCARALRRRALVPRYRCDARHLLLFRWGLLSMASVFATTLAFFAAAGSVHAIALVGFLVPAMCIRVILGDMRDVRDGRFDEPSSGVLG